MALHLHNNNSDGFQQAHLRFGQFGIIDKIRQAFENGGCIREEAKCGKLVGFQDLAQLASSSDSNNQIIQRVLLIQEMLEDLVNSVDVEFFVLNRHPLCDDDGDPSAQQPVLVFLNLNLRDNCPLQKGVEV